MRQQDVASPTEAMRKFVRITNRREGGYIEFQFSIQHQDLFVELILSADAFEEFCVANEVILLEPLE